MPTCNDVKLATTFYRLLKTKDEFSTSSALQIFITSLKTFRIWRSINQIMAYRFHENNNPM